jgi:hypothetical protein
MRLKWLSPNPNGRKLRTESVIQHRDNPHDDDPQCDAWQSLLPDFQKQTYHPSVRPRVMLRFAISETSSAFVDHTGPYKRHKCPSAVVRVYQEVFFVKSGVRQ